MLYLPSGRYLIRDTLTLKPDTVLIGLHPTLAQFDLADDSPGFRGVGAPQRPALQRRVAAPISSAASASSPAASIRAPWVCCGSAGEDSLVDDIRFLGGHGSGMLPYNNDRSADPDLRRRWDGQYPEPLGHRWRRRHLRRHLDAQTPLRKPACTSPIRRRPAMSTSFPTNTTSASRSNSSASRTGSSWRRRPKRSQAKVPRPSRCRSRTPATSPSPTTTPIASRARARPYAAAVRLYNSSGDIHFRNVHVNAESGYAFCDENGCGTFLRASKYPYENAIQDVTHHLEVRDREFAVLDIPATPPPAPGGAVRAAET